MQLKQSTLSPRIILIVGKGFCFRTYSLIDTMFITGNCDVNNDYLTAFSSTPLTAD